MALTLLDTDPRPDMGMDSQYWERILFAALPTQHDPKGDYALLHALRCLGAQANRGNSRLVLTRGCIEKEEWMEWAIPRLRAHLESITQILTTAGQTTERRA